MQSMRLSALLGVVALVGCGTILGIEDHQLAPDGGSPDATAEGGGTDSGADVTVAAEGGSDAATETGADGGQDATLADAGASPDGTSQADASGDGGACTNGCTQGAVQCATGGGAVQTCTMQPSGCAQWTTSTSCGPNQACTGTGSASACACVPSICTGAGAACQDGQTLATCTVDGNGCPYVHSTAPCPSSESCSGTPPSAACSLTCSSSCSQGQTACVSGGLATCTQGGNGCWAYGTPAACPKPNQSCTGSAGSAACTCNAAVENCFNGVDDNCDGLVDCADPQCTGGASPVAQCVPSPGSATAGILSTTATCPAAYPTATPLYAGLNAGSCAGGTCSCVNGLNGSATCSASLVSKGGTSTDCNLGIGTSVFSGTSASGCMSFGALSSTTWYQVNAPTLSATCNPTTGGSPIDNAPTWSTTDAFCAASAFGTGCASGQVCAPAAANHCVLATGDQVACTVAGYSTLNTTPFYTGYDDTGRSCACSCDLGLSCSSVVGFGSGGCSSLYAVSGGCQKDLTYDHAEISAPSGTACTPGATSSGSTSTTGFERTVCCVQ